MSTESNHGLPRLITLQQAADSTQLSARTLRRYIAEGRLTAYRAGRAIRLKPEDVDALFTPTNKWDGGVA
ncbi:helix-turn-helix domain-containing protein [Corynebacterium pseudodiphtheriticum]|uniref:helix-turn-helix domain-containing protein n=1 Tax=Corynebacterium pseudodiphtheriticum TaxID=37637 RepID=UPI0020C0E700|nr:helix-turn-helix domain-containing protein [Corynebacterium pseudodiphtheriticum]UQV57704.1 helix-turn-helix domain-containing protein [Corynebacterium pseudodiphtheriticum]